MRTFATLAVAVTVTGILSIAAGCGKKDDAPAAVAPTGQPGYPPPGTPGYPPAPGAPTAGYPPAPGAPTAGYPPAPAPTAPPPAAGGAMSVPGPLAAPCAADGPSCGTHHCNVQYQKCAFPCANAETDCLAPNGCVLGLCVPKFPGT